MLAIGRRDPIVIFTIFTANQQGMIMDRGVPGDTGTVLIDQSRGLTRIFLARSVIPPFFDQILFDYAHDLIRPGARKDASLKQIKDPQRLQGWLRV